MGMHGRADKKALLYEKDNRCGVCGRELSWSEANIDHILPRSKGGTNMLNNLQLSHFKCNNDKGNKSPFDNSN